MRDPTIAHSRDNRFSYEAAGDPGLPRLVFLHGIGGAARAWRGQLATFSDHFRCLAWDMPGYGGSAPVVVRRNSRVRHCEPSWAKQSGLAPRNKLDGFVAKGSSP